MNEKTIRCTACAAEFSDEETPPEVGSCPTCGSKSVPSRISDDVTLRINWHELRILGIWASNYAGGSAFEDERGQDSRRTLKAILARLEAQHPGKTPLSLAGELKQIAATGHDVELHSGGKVERIQGSKPS